MGHKKNQELCQKIKILVFLRIISVLVMSDSEYSSDDDEDYVPECDSASEEEVDSEEKALTNNKSAPKRKRKGGIKLDDIDDDEDVSSENQDFDEQERIEKERKKQEKNEQAQKARMEDLWSAFKSDTACVRAKPTNTSTSTKAVSSKAESTSAVKPNDAKPSLSSAKPSTNKISITKTFDFAGEAVTVTKTVDADSIEAKKAKKEEKASKQPAVSTSADSLPSIKRKGGLGSVLGQIGKKPKISTLEKSKLDWESFKSETGISDDLKNFNKNGYLERQDFLQRTDQRLFEREKETRAAMRNSRS